MTSKYIIKNAPMISGSHKAQIRKYHKYIGKSGRIWLVADQPNEGDNIYVSGGPNSDGFGGRTLTFTLVDGTEIKLKGPWHTNSRSLLADTDIDVTDKYLTFGVIARNLESGPSYMGTLVDIVYQDKEPVIGTFDRIREMAQEMSNSRKEKLYYWSKSEGGGRRGWVKPKGVLND